MILLANCEIFDGTTPLVTFSAGVRYPKMNALKALTLLKTTATEKFNLI